MNLLNNVKKLIKRIAPGPTDDFWYSFPDSFKSHAGVKVDESTALNYSAVFNAITIYANIIGFLPLDLIQEKKSGTKTKVKDHSAAQVLTDAANDYMPGSMLRNTLGAHHFGWGNCYAEIRTTGSYLWEVDELWPIPPNAVRVTLSDSGRMQYHVRSGLGERIIGREKMLHIPGMAFDGLKGYSIISKAAESIGLGLATQEFGANYFGQGTHPGVVVTHPTVLSEQAHENLKKDLTQKYSGLGKSHRLMLLEEGMSIEKIGIPPGDSQFLETRQFQIPEIARWFNLPPHKLKDLTRATFSNIEHSAIETVVESYVPVLTRFEDYYNFQLLTKSDKKKGLYFKHNVNGLLRGDTKSRGAFYKDQFFVGAITPNEIRRLEDKNPVPGGDRTYIPVNMQPSNQVDNPEPGTVRAIPNGSTMETRSALNIVRGRDKIIKRFYPLLRDAAQRVVNKETLAIKFAAKKHLSKRSFDDFNAWKDSFYNDFDKYVRSNVGLVLIALGSAVAEAAGTEVDADMSELPPEIEKELNSYADDHSKRYIGDSIGQIDALIKQNPFETGETVVERADEWHEKRADKVATNETVRGSNMVAAAVYFFAGFAAVWRIRGSETCPYCKELNGRKVSMGETFMNKNDEITPEGQAPMKIFGMKKHPPLHGGCDCFIVAG